MSRPRIMEWQSLIQRGEPATLMYYAASLLVIGYCWYRLGLKPLPWLPGSRGAARDSTLNLSCFDRLVQRRRM